MRQVIEDLSLQYKKKIIWKFSATSHDKGVVDCTGGNFKSNVRLQVMSIQKDRPILQDSESFGEPSHKLVSIVKN